MDPNLLEAIFHREDSEIMKKCHACGQKLPLKAGDIVEGRVNGRLRRGLVEIPGQTIATMIELGSGSVFALAHRDLTRLHGYYRITEREAL